MAWTSVGFDGTITEIQWAGLAGLLGNGYVAAGNGDCLVTAVPGARSVSVAAGSLYGDGVLSTNSAPETVAMTTPVNGQWYVIALRRTWATNTAALVAIAGATTTTTTPTAPPTSFPVLNTNVGVLTDQPIAWAWCNSANTTVVVYDIRLKAVKSLPPVVATPAERDAKFMSPTQGLQVWRDDLGAVETYYGLYNSSTNPGGRDSAGWYTDTRQTGLVPIRPTSASIATGTGSTNALGQIAFTGATAVSLNGVFSSTYKNYRVIINVKNNTTSTEDMPFRLRAGGTDNSSGYYGTGNESTYNSLNQSTGGSYGYWNISYGVPARITPSSSGIVMDILSPGLSSTTEIIAQGIALNASTGAQYSRNHSISHNVTGSFDGFTFWTFANNFTGTVQVFGYND